LALVLDTGPLYASLDRNDARHLACRRLIESNREPLVIPSPVLVEVSYWVEQRLTSADLLAFLSDIVSAAYFIEDLLPVDYVRACARAV